MNFLVDTHCWLWAFGEPKRLNVRAREALLDQDSGLFLSVASAWEISIKYGKGRLALPTPPEEFIADELERQGIAVLPVTLAHVVRVATLPHHHRDPFDRLLIAQAAAENLVLMTADPAIKSYEVEILWAGN